MAKKQMAWKTKGMNRDISVSAFNPEFSFENMNLRLSTNESNTLLSWVNEKGTAGIELVTKDQQWDEDEGHTRLEKSIVGTPIGTAVINHQLIIFTTHTPVFEDDKPDNIYALRYSDDTKTKMKALLLYSGSLGFSVDNPLETLVSYEAENIQKVYWTDGKNQPRLINIAIWPYDAEDESIYTDISFDFVNELKLEEKVTILKLLGASGMFAPGVIQYAFTYYKKYGQETNIFYTSPLLYISHKDRGASPEDRVENAFRITVSNLDSANFDFLRIYSIHRTSLNGVPECKRVQDVAIKGLQEVSYTDTGLNGNTVDPTELLYKGGESITAKTIEQKDGTLFLGNLKIDRPLIDSDLKGDIETDLRNTPTEQEPNGIVNGYRTIDATIVSSGNDYAYANQLTSTETINNITRSVPCAGFKFGDYYRLGVQFQYKTGKWSDPIHIKDDDIINRPAFKHDNNTDTDLFYSIKLPIFKGTLSSSVVKEIYAKGYRKARAVVVFPNIQDRNVLTQGIVCPTLFTCNHRYDPSYPVTIPGGLPVYPESTHDLFAQPSWFFRPCVTNQFKDNGAIAPYGEENDDERLIPYTNRRIVTEGAQEMYNPEDNSPRFTEIQGDFNTSNQFKIDRKFVTMHSPDIEFDDQMHYLDFSNTTAKQIGYTKIERTLSDIDIQTETPTASNTGAGFIHKSFSSEGMYGIVSGLFYEDYLLDDEPISDNDININARSNQRSPVKFLIHTWHKNGSLNNDINRPANKGIQTAKLKKKVISNLRYAASSRILDDSINLTYTKTPQLFASDEVSILKFDSDIYQGNIDTMLIPDHTEGVYFAYNERPSFTPGAADYPLRKAGVDTPFNINTSYCWWKTFAKTVEGDEHPDGNGAYIFCTNSSGTLGWYRREDDFGSDYLDLVIKKEGVRMKYKSTPHLIFGIDTTSGHNSLNWLPSVNSTSVYNTLPIVEILNPNNPTRFGGNSEDALKENTWIPCGEPVILGHDGRTGDATADGSTVFYYDYGDTYYQRYDCLKTYPFSNEDPNQVVEIGSFMLETRTNIDGRYDRNRGQKSNINMSPRNFNLINPVYSQINNFFSYKIQDSDYYTNTNFPNIITWSKTKESGADVDMWTNITLASTLELDGDKGEVNELIRFNNQLLCFQDTGISQVLYNENVQVSTTDGVPIEIANSGKVQGKRYLSNTIGCSNKWSMEITPAGVYFMDNNDKNIYRLGEGLQNLSQLGGFNSWCKNMIPASDSLWTPIGFNDFTTFYDKMNQDVLFIHKDIALAYSEKINAFTSFYDYGGSPFFCNLDDTGIWLRNIEVEDLVAEGQTPTTHFETALWKHQAGNYCSFFNPDGYSNKPYWMTLIGNQEPLQDKIFTNLEFRATVQGDMTTGTNPAALLPFSSLEVWNEYQHGATLLKNLKGYDKAVHHEGNDSSLLRKFRIWRCDIPRNNYPYETYPVKETGETEEHYQERVEAYNAWLKGEKEKGISRYAKKPLDRMRNMWLYLTLKKDFETQSSLPKAEIHDVVMTYFD